MIRWIDPTIGTAAFGDPCTSGLPVLDVRPLVDGAGNTSDALLSFVTAGIEQLRTCSKLVVCCDYGISRSNTIAAAIVASRDSLPFDAALQLVQQATGERRMDYRLVARVREALSTAPPSRSDARAILLTGGTGFLGTIFRRMAGDRRTIVAPSSQGLDLTGSPYELDRVVAQERPSVIVHLANPRVHQTADVIPQAVSMMRNVLEVSAHHGTFVVFASGWNVLNGRTQADDAAISDDMACRPYGHYAVSKALCECQIDFAREVSGVRAAILRIAPIYGPGSPQPRLIYRIAEALRDGREAETHIYRNGRPSLQLLYVEDAVRALIAAADREIQGRFNVAGELALTTREIARNIAHVLGMPFRSRERQLDADAPQVVLDLSKARQLLGWSPTTPLETGLAEVLHHQDA